MAGGIRVDAVGLVQTVDAADAFEEKGDERRVVLLRDFGEHGGEIAGVVLAHAGGHHHAGDDEFCIRILGTDAVEDGLEILAGDGGFDAAQAVVGAEREDEDVDVLAQNPIDAAGAAGAGFAAEAGVDDAVGKARGGDLFLDERGVAFGQRIVEAVAGGEAVAEKDDGFRGGCGGAEGRDGEGKHAGKEGQQAGEEERPRITRMSAKKGRDSRRFA